MACFIVPATEAIVTTIAQKVVESNEEKKLTQENEKENTCESVKKIPFSRKLGWLNKMLWGGSALLAFEHVWHGEVTPFFPFLSAMENTNDALAMIHEMSTVGVSMALVVTAVWGLMVAVSSKLVKKAAPLAETIEITEEEQ